jgi:glycerol-3-phosphate dehydrogenase
VIERARAVQALAAQEFDLMVIGGGITGAGVALDAAARGLSVALVERRDYAAGASGRSTKLLTGGPRPSRGTGAKLVREALEERNLMLELAPRLVRPLPVLVPEFGGGRPAQELDEASTLDEPLAARRGAPFRRLLSGDEVAELVPALSGRGVTAAHLLYECQVDDARLVLTVLSAAERRGAVCANRLDAVEVVERADGIEGVEVHDAELGGRFFVAADRVIDATGACAERPPWRRDGDAPLPRPIRGTHIVLSDDDLPIDGVGVVVTSERSPRVLALPWLDRVLVGAMDEDDHVDVDDARPRAEDVDRLLEAVNSFFGTELERSDLTGAFAGVWPGTAAGEEGAADMPHPATVHVGSRGMITVTGGQLTAWRRTAERAVDRLLEQDGRVAPCRTREILLAPPRSTTMPERASKHLTDRYGAAAAEVLALAAAEPGGEEPIVAGQPDLLAEATYAARDEQARAVGDVLLRRTRLGLVAPREVSDPAVAQRVARAMATQLGWNERRIADEASAWLREARAEALAASPSAVGHAA